MRNDATPLYDECASVDAIFILYRYTLHTYSRYIQGVLRRRVQEIKKWANCPIDIKIFVPDKSTDYFISVINASHRRGWGASKT